MIHRYSAFVTAALFATAAHGASVLAPGSDEELVPTGKGWGQRSAPGKVAPRAKPVGSSGILYHGGPLLSSPNVYFIWYGNWSGNDATTILTHLAGSIGGSPYFNINTTYSDGNGTAVINVVNYAGSTSDDGYSQGTALSDAGVEGVVAGAISGGKLPADSKGVYFVLTSADVNETSGFCTQYCGWHGHGTIFGADTKYAFVGNPDRCPGACEAQATGPNGNAGADGMASIVAHELEETVTDPNLNAWYDRRGEENADKCAWTYGTIYRTSNGAYANMKLAGHDYLIQRNWANASAGYCALSY